MRIISQKGQKYRDFAYEQCNFSVIKETERCFIMTDTLCYPAIVVAQYSAEEKALKAMEMLHEAYTGTILMQNVEMSDEDKEQLKNNRGIIPVISTGDNVKIEPLNIVWRFPQEDEL